MAETCVTTPLKMRTFEQFDGSQWRHYESDRAIFLLTEVGRKLLATKRIGKLLRSYADDYRNGREAPSDTRRFIAEGVCASVYGVGDTRLAVKEKFPEGDDLFASLHRMDRLIDAVTVDSNCPGWIGVPQHYGIIALKEDTSRQFMLMEKIDDGVTVGDVTRFHNPDSYRPLQLHEAADRLYGPITEEFQGEVGGRYGMAIGELRRALMAKYLSPDVYIPDIDKNPHNIVLEPLATPIDGSHLKFWVIDQ